jgi:hypothetical protein
MLKPTLAAALAALTFSASAPTQAQASEPLIAEDKLLVLGCLEQIEQGTTWGQCVNLMFAPCAAETPGTDGHVACLTGVRGEWSETVRNLQAKVLDVVTIGGQSQIVDLMDLWSKFVVQKCNEVALARSTGAESARLGCEVSEFAGLADEFAACLEGRSTADYCTLKEN